MAAKLLSSFIFAPESANANGGKTRDEARRGSYTSDDEDDYDDSSTVDPSTAVTTNNKENNAGFLARLEGALLYPNKYRDAASAAARGDDDYTDEDDYEATTTDDDDDDDDETDEDEGRRKGRRMASPKPSAPTQFGPAARAAFAAVAAAAAGAGKSTTAPPPPISSPAKPHRIEYESDDDEGMEVSVLTMPSALLGGTHHHHLENEDSETEREKIMKPVNDTSLYDRYGSNVVIDDENDAVNADKATSAEQQRQQKKDGDKDSSAGETEVTYGKHSWPCDPTANGYVARNRITPQQREELVSVRNEAASGLERMMEQGHGGSTVDGGGNGGNGSNETQDGSSGNSTARYMSFTHGQRSYETGEEEESDKSSMHSSLFSDEGADRYFVANDGASEGGSAVSSAVMKGWLKDAITPILERQRSNLTVQTSKNVVPEAKTVTPSPTQPAPSTAEVLASPVLYPPKSQQQLQQGSGGGNATPQQPQQGDGTPPGGSAPPAATPSPPPLPSDPAARETYEERRQKQYRQMKGKHHPQQQQQQQQPQKVYSGSQRQIIPPKKEEDVVLSGIQRLRNIQRGRKARVGANKEQKALSGATRVETGGVGGVRSSSADDANGQGDNNTSKTSTSVTSPSRKLFSKSQVALSGASTRSLTSNGTNSTSEAGNTRKQQHANLFMMKPPLSPRGSFDEHDNAPTTAIREGGVGNSGRSTNMSSPAPSELTSTDHSNSTAPTANTTTTIRTQSPPRRDRLPPNFNKLPPMSPRASFDEHDGGGGGGVNHPNPGVVGGMMTLSKPPLSPRGSFDDEDNGPGGHRMKHSGLKPPLSPRGSFDDDDAPTATTATTKGGTGAAGGGGSGAPSVKKRNPMPMSKPPLSPRASFDEALDDAQSSASSSAFSSVTPAGGARTQQTSSLSSLLPPMPGTGSGAVSASSKPLPPLPPSRYHGSVGPTASSVARAPSVGPKKRSNGVAADGAGVDSHAITATSTVDSASYDDSHLLNDLWTFEEETGFEHPYEYDGGTSVFGGGSCYEGSTAGSNMRGAASVCESSTAGGGGGGDAMSGVGSTASALWTLDDIEVLHDVVGPPSVAAIGGEEGGGGSVDDAATSSQTEGTDRKAKGGGGNNRAIAPPRRRVPLPPAPSTPPRPHKPPRGRGNRTPSPGKKSRGGGPPPLPPMSPSDGGGAEEINQRLASSASYDSIDDSDDELSKTLGELGKAPPLSPKQTSHQQHRARSPSPPPPVHPSFYGRQNTKKRGNKTRLASPGKGCATSSGGDKVDGDNNGEAANANARNSPPKATNIPKENVPPEGKAHGEPAAKSVRFTTDDGGNVDVTTADAEAKRQPQREGTGKQKNHKSDVHEHPMDEVSVEPEEEEGVRSWLTEASVIHIQAVYRGMHTRQRLLLEMGISKRRRWESRTKSKSTTRIHSDIRRMARALLRLRVIAQSRGTYHGTGSMVLAVRRVCVIRIQKWYRQHRLIRSVAAEARTRQVQRRNKQGKQTAAAAGGQSRSEAALSTTPAMRRTYRGKKKEIVKIQSAMRRFLRVRYFERIRPAVVLIQSVARMFVQKMLYAIERKLRLSYSGKNWKRRKGAYSARTMSEGAQANVSFGRAATSTSSRGNSLSPASTAVPAMKGRDNSALRDTSSSTIADNDLGTAFSAPVGGFEDEEFPEPWADSTEETNFFVTKSPKKDSNKGWVEPDSFPHSWKRPSSQRSFDSSSVSRGEDDFNVGTAWGQQHIMSSSESSMPSTSFNLTHISEKDELLESAWHDFETSEINPDDDDDSRGTDDDDIDDEESAVSSLLSRKGGRLARLRNRISSPTFRYRSGERNDRQEPNNGGKKNGRDRNQPISVPHVTPPMPPQMDVDEDDPVLSYMPVGDGIAEEDESVGDDTSNEKEIHATGGRRENGERNSAASASKSLRTSLSRKDGVEGSSTAGEVNGGKTTKTTMQKSNRGTPTTVPQKKRSRYCGSAHDVVVVVPTKKTHPSLSSLSVDGGDSVSVDNSDASSRFPADERSIDRKSGIVGKENVGRSEGGSNATPMNGGGRRGGGENAHKEQVENVICNQKDKENVNEEEANNSNDDSFSSNKSPNHVEPKTLIQEKQDFVMEEFF